MKTRIERVDPKDLPLLKMNARYMKHEEFKRLVYNIKEDGCLTSVPLVCVGEDGTFESVLSGNHRVKAAIEAGLQQIDVMIIEDLLPEQKRVAIQLAHNAIVGQDDVSILKNLYEALEIDMKMYAGLDDKTLETIEKTKLESLSQASLDFKTISLCFLPGELENAKRHVEHAKEEAKRSEAWVMYGDDFERYLDSIDEAQSTFGIKNTAVALSMILAFWEDNHSLLSQEILERNSKADNTQWIPNSTIIGGYKMPQGAAKTVIAALNKMKNSGLIEGKNLWKGIEIMANEYLTSK